VATPRPVVVCLLAAACLTGKNCGAAAPTAGDRGLGAYYAGLRDRQMFAVAEADALRRLGSDTLSPSLRAELAIELSRTYARHAIFSVGLERDELWERACQVVDALRESVPETPYAELLETQRAFVTADQGAQLRWHVELYPRDVSARAAARETLSEAVARLQTLPAGLTVRTNALINELRRVRTVDDAPHPARVRAMQREVDFRTAATFLDLAKVLSALPERTAALQEADVLFTRLTKIAEADEFAWHAAVALLAVNRVREAHESVDRDVANLLSRELPPDVRAGAVAERCRSLLDRGRPDEALEALRQHQAERGSLTEELRGVLVDGLLQGHRLALERGNADSAGDLLAQAESTQARMTGPWGYRAQLRVEAAREIARLGPSLADQLDRGQWAWRNGQFAEAVAAYGEAAAAAHAAGRTDLTVDVALTLAALQRESGKLVEAARVLDGLLSQYPEHRRAAEADLLRAFIRGQQFEAQPDQTTRRAYRNALEEHRRRYAERPTIHQATWMLARLAEHEQAWDETVTLLETLPAEDPRRPDADQRMGQVYEKWLEELRARGEPTEMLSARAIAALTRVTTPHLARRSPLAAGEADACWRLAMLLLRQPAPDFVRADQLLARVLESAATTPEAASEKIPVELRISAAQERIISLAGQGKLDAARRVLEELAGSQPEPLLDVLDGLSEVGSEIALEHRHDIGQLQLDLARQLLPGRNQLAPQTQSRLDESLAQGLAATGDHSGAMSVYGQLLVSDPRNPRLLTALARLEEQLGTVGGWQQAARHWQELQATQTSGSKEWFEARYRLAVCHHALGDDATARKLIGVTRVLYPDLGSPAQKARFDQLEGQLR
jgi:tetratricopeptide (TPR) repeat protein